MCLPSETRGQGLLNLALKMCFLTFSSLLPTNRDNELLALSTAAKPSLDNQHLREVLGSHFHKKVPM